jgi:GntR family transcriptional repressor for pyruvate dehydrogenase complex
MLEPISKTRLSQSAIEAINIYIAENDLAPGAKLPSERSLSEYLNISRASVREALRIMEIIGILEVKPGSGIFFRDRAGDLSIPLTAWLPRKEETLREIFEVRQLIEPRAAGLAAERVSPDILEKMKFCLERFGTSVEQNDLASMILADTEFHRLLATATQNKTLTFLMNTMTRYLPEGWKASLMVPQRPKKTIAEHKLIFEAIKTGDAISAIQAMTDHLATAIEEIQQLNLKRNT